MVKLGNTTKAVNEAMCLNAGLRKPSTIKRCGGTEWKVAEWAPVRLSSSFASSQFLLFFLLKLKLFHFFLLLTPPSLFNFSLALSLSPFPFLLNTHLHLHNPQLLIVFVNLISYFIL